MLRFFKYLSLMLFLFGSVEVILPRPKTAVIKMNSGVPMLQINEKIYPPFAWMSYLGETEYYREAAAAGIHLFCFPAYLGDRGINTRSGIGPFRPSLWRGENEFDFTSLTTDFEKILVADPRAMVIIRLHLDPPEWWERANPDACRQLPDGSTYRQCFAAEKWRRATGATLERVVEWLLNSPFREYLIGIHLAAGETEEWLYHLRENYEDLNPVRTAAFRQWLREKYGQEIRLQQAWQNLSVTFGTAVPADISGRVRVKRWRDPKTEQPVLDTFRFHAATLVENIIYFCKITKAASKGKLLTGAFYGYHYFIDDARRGHGRLQKLLECPELDFLSSPNAYLRKIGEDWPPMTAIQSVQLHGKLWLAENDTRTSQTTLLKDRAPDICPPEYYDSGVWLGPPDVTTSVALLRKNSARMLAQNYGGWWFDMWGGWFSHPEFLQVLQETQTLWQMYPPQIVPEMQPEICVLADEELAFYDASFGRLTGKVLSNRHALGKIGTPYDLFLRADWPRIDHHYRLIWLLGVPEADITEFTEPGAVVLWTNLLGTTVISPENKHTEFPGKFYWSPAELIPLLQQAGIHRYLETEEVVYAGNGWLSLHTVEGGLRTVRLPFTATVTEPLEQKVIAKHCQSFDIVLPERSTTILRIEPEE